MPPSRKRNAASAAILSVAFAAGPGALPAGAATLDNGESPSPPPTLIKVAELDRLIKVTATDPLAKVVDTSIKVVERLASNHNETVLHLG